MCGRYTLHLQQLDELRALLGLQKNLISSWQPRYNIAPTQLAPVVLARGERTLQALRWGLIPSWAKDARVGNRLINARVESIASRPSFREAFRARRCVAPATGYFEWRAMPGERVKQPVWIRPNEGGIMALAGVHESWVSKDGEVVDSFAIVTTTAIGSLREIHDRMPLELRGAGIERWLEPGSISDVELADLVQSAHDVTHLGAQEVDRRVSSPAVDDPGCIAPLVRQPEAGPRKQLGLFD
jgi:putative SOS response-associated peptidase YedK